MRGDVIEMSLSTETPFGTYTPKQLDTSCVELPCELAELRELIAEQVHDTWAIGRLEQGWTYGPKRDDDLKQNPTLVPYGDLSEDEKAYDRNTAEGTLKMLVQLGWTITPPAADGCGCGCDCDCDCDV